LRHYLASPDFYLIGVDVNAEAVETARKQYDEVYLSNIASDAPLDFSREPGTIVFGDILEHLPNPVETLTTILSRYAGPGTQVIISLPNIAHLYVRLNLLLGRFEYADRGILDRTHLRFFTLRSARQLVLDSGLILNSVSATPVPLPLVSPLFGEGSILYPVHVLSSVSARLSKPLLAYQIVLEARYDA
jgi:hypothetical protein